MRAILILNGLLSALSLWACSAVLLSINIPIADARAFDALVIATCGALFCLLATPVALLVLADD